MAFIYDLTDTWNAGGTTFNAIKMNVTDSASAAASKLITLQVGGAERFGVRKDGQGYFAGNVGIGTSSPAERLHVSGNLLVEGSSGTICDAIVDMADQRLVLGSYFEAGIGQHSFISSTNNAETGNSPLLFRTGTTERMRIDSSGNLLVGTTTSFGKFSVYGTAGFNADANATIPGAGSYKFRGSAGATTITTYDYLNYTAMQFIRDNGNPTNTVGSITCTDTATTYNTSSDRRLKKDIAPAGDAGTIIDSIEIVSHGWRNGEGTVPFGVIAQDLHAVAPQAVHAGDDGEEVGDVWGVDYSKLVPMLVKEIQSLRARVAELEISASTITFEGN